MKKFISILFMLMLGVSMPCLAQSTQEHVVKVGEDFESIAEKYGITVQQLKDMNPKHRGVFYVGMKLNVPKLVQRTEPAAAPVVAAKKDKKAEAKAKKEEAKAKKEEAKAKKEEAKAKKEESKAKKEASKKDKSSSKADKEAEKEAKKAAKEAEKAEKAAARKAKLEERKSKKKK